jgi:ribosomal protein L28
LTSQAQFLGGEKRSLKNRSEKTQRLLLVNPQKVSFSEKLNMGRQTLWLSGKVVKK